MKLWLDHLIFGNGHGMATPYWNGVFYWLKDQNTERGALYQWSAGFGAQLYSRQWTHPRAGETRRFLGRDWRPFRSTRRWLRVEVAWCTKLPDGIDEANVELRLIQAELQSPNDPPIARSLPGGGHG